MAAFAGKWKLTETHNDDEFLKSIGYSQEAREVCKPVNDPKNNVVAEYITKDPKEIKNIMFVDGKELFTQCTPLGCDIVVTDPTGAQSKIRKHTIEGNKIFLEQELEGNHVATYETTVDGDRMYEHVCYQYRPTEIRGYCVVVYQLATDRCNEELNPHYTTLKPTSYPTDAACIFGFWGYIFTFAKELMFCLLVSNTMEE